VKTVDQADLQGNILCGYGRRYTHGLYLFFRVENAGAARRWLGDAVPHIATAVPWGADGPRHTLNVAFTFAGLRKLGVDDAVLRKFPEDFRQGMEARAHLLGDTGPSDPEGWEPRLRQAHGVITVMALDGGTRDERRRELEAQAADAGLAVRAQDTALAGEREPFGFRDGISQPAIKDPKAGPYRHTDTNPEIAPGEFVLGYRDEGGSTPEPPPRVGASGSYMVVRKLEQKVDGFWAYIREEAGPDEARQQWLAARLVGRWPDGTPLIRSPQVSSDGQARTVGWLNDFTYAADPDGFRCPIGAHIRRANPRDALDPEWRFANRHRIIRRGMAYPPEGDPERPGLMFVCFQASIERQFEFVQSQWCNDGNVFGLGSDPDFIVGPEEGKMTVQGDPPRFLPMRRFVTTRGGDYFFAPGLAALRHIAGQRP
jgi:Dyp-type peroxidase family